MKEGSRAATEGLLKIGDLAKQTGTSITTLKYYVREGLIRPVLKTGRNMSWYDPSCIETVNVIHMLQKERYYPLSVIRDLLETDTLRKPPEMALLDAIHKVDENTEPQVFTAREAVRLTGIERDQIDALSEAGLISTTRKKRREFYTEDDIVFMKLVRRRLEAGIPLDQSIAAFRIYDRALRNAARDDIDTFVELIMQPDFSAQAGAHMIRVSDQTLDQFIILRRKEYNRSYGKSYVEKLYRFLLQCAGVPEKLGKAYRKYGFTEAASICSDAAAGVLPDDENAAEQIRMFLGSETGQKSDLITKIIACQRSREYFSTAPARSDGSTSVHSDGSPSACNEIGFRSAGTGDSLEMRLLTDSLRCLWLTMAPDALQCDDAAREARTILMQTLKEIRPDKSEQIYRDIIKVIK